MERNCALITYILGMCFCVCLGVASAILFHYSINADSFKGELFFPGIFFLCFSFLIMFFLNSWFFSHEMRLVEEASTSLELKKLRENAAQGASTKKGGAGDESDLRRDAFKQLLDFKYEITLEYPWWITSSFAVLIFALFFVISSDETTRYYGTGLFILFFVMVCSFQFSGATEKLSRVMLNITKADLMDAE